MAVLSGTKYGGLGLNGFVFLTLRFVFVWFKHKGVDKCLMVSEMAGGLELELGFSRIPGWEGDGQEKLPRTRTESF